MRTMILTALLLLGAAPQEEPKPFVNKEHGFRISRPAQGWAIQETGKTGQYAFSLKIYRQGRRTETSVTIWVQPNSPFTSSKQVADRVESGWASNPKYEDLNRGTADVAGHKTHFIEYTMTSAGTTYAARAYLLVQDKTYFAIQLAWPKGQKDEGDLKDILKTFTFIKREGVGIRILANKCGSEVRFASAWEEAATRARHGKKLIMVVAELYSGFKYDSYAPSTIFMDPDLIELMQTRIVPLMWRKGMKAPIQDPKVYGMGPNTFGRGILFATPEGRVVGESFSLTSFFLYRQALEILRANPRFKGQSVGSAEGLELADALMQRGRLDEAWTVLKNPKTAAGFRLQASLLRRLRLGKEALKAIREARRLDDGELTDALLVDEGLIHLRMANDSSARKCFRTLIKDHPDSPFLPEARYGMAMAELYRGGLESVNRRFQELTEQHPDSRFAWKAAAYLPREGYPTRTPDERWPNEDVIRSLTRVAPEPGDADDLDRVEKDAVDFLLNQQQEDGGFITPNSLTRSSYGLPVAVASIAGRSLLRFRERPEVSDAVDAALSWVLRIEKAGGIKAKWGSQFDMTIWAQIFSLRFLAACVENEIGERDRIVDAMKGIVAELKKDQHKSGGWAYVKMTPNGQDDNSIGFCTAAGVLALLDAEAVGVKVPDRMLNRAIGSLSDLSEGGGSFRYMRRSGRAGGPESSLRSPLYAYTLLRTEKGGVDAIRAAMEKYLKYRKHVRKERGKTLCHTAQEGTASYYLLYGYAWSAEAMRKLPRREHERLRAAILDDVLQARMKDGSFLDNPMVGRTYGTAMALQALDHLRRK